MANRLTQITTRTGDDGSTGLGNGVRVRKSSLRIAALGEIDELNSYLGVVLADPLTADMRSRLQTIQNQLFDLGGEISIPGHTLITTDHILQMDNLITLYNQPLPPLKEFILPGGSRASAHIHVARSVARRAERALAALNEQEPVSILALQYLNRLSDLLFIMARTANRESGVADVLWQRQPY